MWLKVLILVFFLRLLDSTLPVKYVYNTIQAWWNKKEQKRPTILFSSTSNFKILSQSCQMHQISFLQSDTLHFTKLNDSNCRHALGMLGWQTKHKILSGHLLTSMRTGQIFGPCETYFIAYMLGCLAYSGSWPTLWKRKTTKEQVLTIMRLDCIQMFMSNLPD